MTQSLNPRGDAESAAIGWADHFEGYTDNVQILGGALTVSGSTFRNLTPYPDGKADGPGRYEPADDRDA